MAPDVFRKSLILTGPTGSGKTLLALELAERLDAEIVSMDSMAVYRGMDIGTAKPGREERRRVPHHLIDVLDPWESASVAWWLEQAAVCCRDIESRGRPVLFVGGTPLYLKALLRGLFDGPPADANLRQRLADQAEQSGPHTLHDRLAQVDPATAARLHPNDVRRIIRALEVWELTGQPISAWQQQWKTGGQGDKVTGGQGDKGTATAHLSVSPCHPVTLSPCLPALWLDLPRSELYARINARVVRMIDAGLVEEARNLRQLPRPMSREAVKALGYKEMFEYLDGTIGLEEAIQRIQIRSRNFAKRQLTWFRHMPECRPVTPELTFAAWGLTMNQGKDEG